MERCREAVAGDLHRVVELSELAWHEFVAERGGTVWSRREAPRRPRTDEFAGAIDDRDRLLVVGTFADYTVGYGLARLEALRDGELLAVVADLFVEVDFRDVAVGEAMMDAMLTWARTRHATGVDSLVLPGMRASKNFFERYGMKARALMVHLELDDAGPARSDGHSAGAEGSAP